MSKEKVRRTLLQAYRFAGYRTMQQVQGKFGDSNGVKVLLKRRSKKVYARNAAAATEAITTDD